MKVKKQKKLEKGTLVRTTIQGVFTEIDDRWFLSLEDCLLQVVDNPDGGIKANDEIVVRVVPDHKSLESELNLLEQLVVRTLPEDYQNINYVSAFAQKLAQYAPAFTQFLSVQEQDKYKQLILRTARLSFSSKIMMGMIRDEVSRYDSAVEEELSQGNIFVSRYSDLGSYMLAMKEKLESIYKLFETIDKKDYDENLKEARKYVDKELTRIRKLVKSSVLQIKQANAKDLPDILKSLDHFTNTFTEYRSRTESGAHKRAILEFHQERLKEHYVLMLDGKIVGGLRISTPTEEDRESIGYRTLKEKDRNIMITGFGSSADLDKNIGQAIKEAHSFITELGYWRVYTGIIMKDASHLASLERGRLTASYVRQELPMIHAAMVDAGFVPFKARTYTTRDEEKHNLGGCKGELIYRSKSVENHPGRTAE